MKTFVSALALGLVVAFSAPAFAATGNAYVGDMIGNQPAAKSANKTAENSTPEKTIKRHARKHVY
jgi:hypothetical protein